MNYLGFDIFFDKRFANIIDNLKPENYVILLICFNLRGNAYIMKFCIFFLL